VHSALQAEVLRPICMQLLFYLKTHLVHMCDLLSLPPLSVLEVPSGHHWCSGPPGRDQAMALLAILLSKEWAVEGSL
jgi:hypothetical protein